MSKKIKKSILLIIIFYPMVGIHSQESIHASGGIATGIGGSNNYSIGQAFYITDSEPTCSVSPGVEQPFEISTLFGTYEVKDIILTASTYPNPTSDFLILRVNEIKIVNLYFQLFDINGRILKEDNISSIETKIEMNNYISGLYLLKIYQNNAKIKMFKIIKK